MFDKNLFNDLKNRAKEAVDNVKTEAQNLHATVNEKLDEKLSTGNNLAEKGREYLSNETPNKSVQFVLEKSIKQAEDFVEKFFRPYDVHEILSQPYVDETIKELKQKQLDNPLNEIYTYELSVLYFNKSQDELAHKEFNKLQSQELIATLKPVVELSGLREEGFRRFYQSNKEAIQKARVYRFIRGYAEMCCAHGEYFEAISNLELACSLNPASIEINELLSNTYKKLNREDDVVLQSEILNLLRGV